MNASAVNPTPPRAGATYRLVVGSAQEAVETIRRQLGAEARVLSVRPLPSKGLAGWLGRTQLEVIAQLPAPGGESAPVVAAPVAGAAPAPVRGSFFATDDSPATPADVLTGGNPLHGASSRAELDRASAGPRARAATDLPSLLRRSGVSDTIISRLELTPAWRAAAGRPLHQALADVGRELRRAAERRPLRPLPDRVAFLGAAGVGRTTALCKWLGREVFAERRMGRVVKAEFGRPNPAEGLAVFCDALGLVLENTSDVAPALPGAGVDAVAARGAFLCADLPAISLQSSAANQPLARFLEAGAFTGRVLVLNALHDLPTLRSAHAAGRDLGATHLVFTHLDELGHWGKLWDFLLEGELSPLFLATGPSLTGDLEADAVAAVLRRTIPGA